MPENLNTSIQPTAQATAANQPPQGASVQTQPIATTQQQITYAGFWVRYGALFVDGIVLGVPIYAVVAFFNIFPVFIPPIIFTVISGMIYIFTDIYFIKRFGATPGKMFYGLKIVASNGNTPEIPKIIMREFTGKLISILLFGVGFIWVVYDKEKRAFHDKIAKTHVVSTLPITSLRKNLIYLFIIPIILSILVILVSLILHVINPTKRAQQSRDDQRKNDIGLISYGFRGYFSVHEQFPSNLYQIVSLEGISKLPIDPNGEDYTYLVSSGGSKMALYAKLENGKLGKSSVWCLKSFAQPPHEVSSPDDCQP